MNITIDLGQVLFGLAALATAVFPILSWRASRRNEKNIAKVNEKVDVVHDLTNSNTIRMESLAHTAGLAQGNLEGRAEQTLERQKEGL